MTALTAQAGRLTPVTLLPSAMRPVVRAVLRFGVRPWLGRLPVRGQRLLLDAATAFQLVPGDVAVARTWMRGVAAERLRDGRRRRDRAVLYLHGGAYVALRPRAFRALTARIARGAAADVYVPDYRLAPEQPYPAALDDALNAYRWLLREGYEPGRITIVGDSAGGGLALALLLALRDGAAPLPGRAALVSPWLDTDGCGAGASAALAARDPVLDRAWLARSARAYAGPSLHAADLAGLPPLLVIAASHEVLLPDAEALVARASRAGLSVAGRRYDGLWHDFPMQAGILPEAAHAVREIVTFVRRGLGDPDGDGS